MSEIAKLRVMISSRSLSKVFDGTPLAEVRKRLQARLHALRWQAPTLGDPADSPAVVGRNQSMFDVWIHENAPSEAADATTFQISLREIRRADLVIALYTGEAGSAAHDSEMGICHAELHEAISRRPDIVSLIALSPLSASTRPRDVQFRAFVESRNLFSATVNDEDTLHNTVFELLQERIAVLAKKGGLGAARLRDRGEALDWNQLAPAERRRVMRDALRAALSEIGTDVDSARKRPVSPRAETAVPPAELALMRLPSGAKLMVRPDAIPAALGVAAARELVGQPFMSDHAHSNALEAADVGGIVHVIACHRGATEAQALRMLGTPDAVAISSDFGILVADHVQRIQLVLLAQCSDATSIELSLRRFDEWLRQSGEEARLLERGRARRRILAALAAVQ